jgi:hypothetical protein
LRNWLSLASQSAAEQHAAALLLADQVLRRVSDCAEFAEEPYNYAFENAEEAERTSDALKKDFEDLGIEVEQSARPSPQYYNGNLRGKILALAPTGAMNELYWMDVLNDRCQWSAISDADCSDVIKNGETFLSRFSEDEWSPSVHLILAEAYSITVADEGESDSADSSADREKLLKKVSDHYRAWYEKSRNERDRALVWEEIWAIQAGMGPWLLVPDNLRH